MHGWVSRPTIPSRRALIERRRGCDQGSEARHIGVDPHRPPATVVPRAVVVLASRLGTTGGHAPFFKAPASATGRVGPPPPPGDARGGFVKRAGGPDPPCSGRPVRTRRATPPPPPTAAARFAPQRRPTAPRRRPQARFRVLAPPHATRWGDG